MSCKSEISETDFDKSESATTVMPNQRKGTPGVNDVKTEPLSGDE